MLSTKEEPMCMPIREGLLLLLLSGLALGGCLGPGDARDSQDSGNADAITIADIQQGEVTDGTAVSLYDVVVTSGWTADQEGFFIQDEGGGAFSGIFVYTAGPLDDYEPAVGDLVNVGGSVSEYKDFTELAVGTSRAIQKNGTAQAVTDLLDAGGPADWETWESCLVTLPDQTATSGVNNYGEVSLSSGIAMDNLFADFLVSSGDVLGDVTGPIAFSFDTFKINPRSPDDLENGGTVDTVSVHEIQDGTVATDDPAQVEGVIACSGLSLDGKGFFVQDAGGGSYSGVFVYVRDQKAIDVAAGDVLDILGTVQEYYDFTELAAYSEDIVPTGGSSTCTTTQLDATPTDWEPYEGVALALSDVEITASADYGQVETNWGINLDPFLFAFDLSSGQSFSMVEGLLSYSYGAWVLCPRSEMDLVAR
jgi:predicted extracellular nuclease